jgi:hypothetical protein
MMLVAIVTALFLTLEAERRSIHARAEDHASLAETERLNAAGLPPRPGLRRDRSEPRRAGAVARRPLPVRVNTSSTFSATDRRSLRAASSGRRTRVALATGSPRLRVLLAASTVERSRTRAENESPSPWSGSTAAPSYLARFVTELTAWRRAASTASGFRGSPLGPGALEVNAATARAS